MNEQWIAEQAIRTAITLPVLVLIATLCWAYMVGYVSYAKASEVRKHGLIATGIALLLSWMVVIINAIVVF